MRMMAMMIMKMERQRIPARASLRFRGIRTFQRSKTGMEISIASVIMSRIADALKIPFCLAKAPGVTHLTAREVSHPL